MPSSENSKFFYVYVLKSLSAGKEFYIGQTTDLKKRVEEHNKGLNFSTKTHRPWELIYFEGHEYIGDG